MIIRMCKDLWKIILASEKAVKFDGFFFYQLTANYFLAARAFGRATAYISLAILSLKPFW